MTFRERGAAIVVCVMIFFAAAVRAQVSGKIEGTAVDEDGKSLSGVKVEAGEPQNGTRTTSTDKAGRYRFVGLRPGGYTVTFTLDSHAEVQKKGTVRLDGTVTINAKMFRIAG